MQTYRGVHPPKSDDATSLLPFPSLFLSLFPSPSLPPPLSLPLEVGSLESNSKGVWGSAVSSPGGAPAEIEFGAF